MDKELQQKVAFITGAASGIGIEVAKEFAKEGAKVVISDLNEVAAQKAVSLLKEKGYDALAIGCDVTKEEQIEQSINYTVENFGKIDILINNAGLQHVA